MPWVAPTPHVAGVCGTLCSDDPCLATAVTMRWWLQRADRVNARVAYIGDDMTEKERVNWETLFEEVPTPLSVSWSARAVSRHARAQYGRGGPGGGASGLGGPAARGMPLQRRLFPLPGQH
jgi:hypothetical protein